MNNFIYLKFQIYIHPCFILSIYQNTFKNYTLFSIESNHLSNFKYTFMIDKNLQTNLVSKSLR